MPVIVVSGFQGEQPRIAPRLLPPSGSQNAVNVRLSDGALTPVRSSTQDGIAGAAGHKTIYRHGSTWLGWASADVRLAEGPVAQDRLYYTGDGVPKMRLADGTIFPLAVPRPTAAPTVTVTGTATGTDTISRLYAYTFVTDYGEESEPCPIPNSVNWIAGQTVTLSGIEAAPSGRAITKQRFYRTQTGKSGTYLYLIEERIASATNYVDNVPIDRFYEPLPSASWNAPPDGLQGLISMPNGMMAGFVGKDVYFCEPFRPHAWPETYVMTSDSAIVALAAIANTLVVLTEKQPWILAGAHPSSMQMVKTEQNMPCINARGVADLGFAVVYPTHDGLVAVRPNGASGIVSGNLFTRDEWLELSPDTMIGCQYGNLYAGFYDVLNDDGSRSYGAIMIDISGAAATMSRQNMQASAAWFDVATGGTYVLPVGSTGIMRIDSPDAPPVTFSWKSKPFVHKEPVNYAVMLIEADTDLTDAEKRRFDALVAAATVTNAAIIAAENVQGALHSKRINQQRLGGDNLTRVNRSAFTGQSGFAHVEGVIIADKKVVGTLSTTNVPKRLKAGFKATEWEIVISGNVRVSKISMATTMQELQQSPPG